MEPVFQTEDEAIEYWKDRALKAEERVRSALLRKAAGETLEAIARTEQITAERRIELMEDFARRKMTERPDIFGTPEQFGMETRS